MLTEVGLKDLVPDKMKQCLVTRTSYKKLCPEPIRVSMLQTQRPAYIM
jgi:hypothetical protein